MKSISKLLIYILPGLIFLFSCQKKFLCTDCTDSLPPNNNQPPVAMAGADQVLLLPINTTILDGSLSAGHSLSYKWKKLSGPVLFNITMPDAAKTQIENLVSGVYSFELTVTDNVGLSAKDTVNITVNISNHKHPPAAIAGDDQFISLPTNTTTINGGGSYDPDGNIVSYSWRQIAGPGNATINNATQAITGLANLVDSVYQFELTVTDNDGLFAKDTIAIYVMASSGCPSVTLTWSLDKTTGLMALIDSSQAPYVATLYCGAGGEALIPVHYNLYLNVGSTNSLLHLNFVFRSDIAITSESIFLSSTVYHDPNDGDLSFPVVYAKPDAPIDFTKPVTVRNIP